MIKVVPKEVIETGLRYDDIKNCPGIYKFLLPKSRVDIDPCRVIILKLVRSGDYLRLHFNGTNLYNLANEDIYNSEEFVFQKMNENLIIGE